MASAPESRPSTRTGTKAFRTVVRLPSWPTELSPQHKTRPPSSIAQVCFQPAAIAKTVFVKDWTATGTGLYPVSPFPSSPEELSPQQTAPSSVIAHVWSPPAVTAPAPLGRLSTWAGTELSAVELFPSWPEAPLPQ